jgi:mRNA interferase YafQ
MSWPYSLYSQAASKTGGLPDVLLPARCVDHAMKGKWKGYRDCHIKPDEVLIYCKQDVDILELVRLGSHSELGI